MRYPSAIRNITARRLLRALERDGFTCTTRRKGTLLYRHPDGRRVEVHFHSSGQTFPLGTLRAMLEDAGWAIEDFKRLGLVSRRDP